MLRDHKNLSSDTNNNSILLTQRRERLSLKVHNYSSAAPQISSDNWELPVIDGDMLKGLSECWIGVWGHSRGQKKITGDAGQSTVTLFSGVSVTTRGTYLTDSVKRTIIKLLDHRKNHFWSADSFDGVEKLSMFDFLYFSARGKSSCVFGESLMREAKNLLQISKTTVNVGVENNPNSLVAHSPVVTGSGFDALDAVIAAGNSSIKAFRLALKNSTIDLKNCGVGYIQQLCETDDLGKYKGNVFSLPKTDCSYTVSECITYGIFDSMTLYKNLAFEQKSWSLEGFAAAIGKIGCLINHNRKRIGKTLCKMSRFFGVDIKITGSNVHLIMLKRSSKQFAIKGVNQIKAIKKALSKKIEDSKIYFQAFGSQKKSEKLELENQNFDSNLATTRFNFRLLSQSDWATYKKGVLIDFQKFILGNSPEAIESPEYRKFHTASSVDVLKNERNVFIPVFEKWITAEY